MSVTRREFLVSVPVVGAALVWAPRRGPQSPGGLEGGLESHAANALGANNVSGMTRAPVVSFHLDQPYLDLTGLAKPYVPPVGMRSGASLAALSEEEVLSRFYGFI